MKTFQIDAKGDKCPVPVLKMTNAIMKKEVDPGDTLVVVADCPTFEKDVKDWCRNMKKVLVVFREEGNNIKRCEVKI
jgi:tRNA 2-thiouridine synthesizing protein A